MQETMSEDQVEVQDVQDNNTQEQELRASARLIASLLDEPNPVGLPLTANFKQGFAYKTIGHRLPVILTKVIDQLSRDKNEIGEKRGAAAREEVKVIVGALAKLKNEMQTNKTISKTSSVIWDTYIELMATRYFEGDVSKVNYYFTPWLFVECYMYKRLNDAFRLTKSLKFYDIFQKQKEESWLQSIDAAEFLGNFIKTAEHSDANLQKFLEISLWGNRCDLSISGGAGNSQTQNPIEQLQDLKKSILCDDSAKFWDSLKNNKSSSPSPSSFGYVLDNAGFELFTDLCFADALMNVVERVDFHVKAMPWFVSDALVRDFNWLLESMSICDKPVLVHLTQKWRGFVSSGRWTVIESDFWTYPHAFYEMESADPKLYSKLSQNTCLVFKGDLNYRKLIGDINWAPDTPFKESLQGFSPSPLVALRTLKADCVSGLPTGKAEEIAKDNPDWMVTGEFGIIQHCA